MYKFTFTPPDITFDTRMKAFYTQELSIGNLYNFLAQQHEDASNYSAAHRLYSYSEIHYRTAIFTIPLNTEPIFLEAISYINACEVFKEYGKSAKKVCQVLDRYPELSLLVQRFQALVCNRKKWICTLDEFHGLMEMQSTTAYATMRFANKLNKNVKFQLTTGKSIKSDELERKDIEFIVHIDKLTDDEIKLVHDQLSPQGYKIFQRILKNNNDLDVLVLDSGSTTYIPSLYCQKVVLSRRGYNDKDCISISNFFMNNHAMHSLDFSNNNIGDDGACALAKALELNDTLTKLDLRANNIGHIGTKAFAKGSWLHNISHKLSIHNEIPVGEFRDNLSFAFDCSKSVNDIDAIIIAALLKSNSSLSSIQLTSSSIGDIGSSILGHALKVNYGLTIMDISSNRVGHIGARGIGDGLKSNSMLQILDLGDNQIGHPGAHALSDALLENNVLETLILGNIQGGNDIRDKGAATIAQMLKVNSSLTQLQLSSNNISDKGARDLGEGLKYNSTLRFLDLSLNDISNNGSIALVKHLETNSILSLLCLMQNNIDEIVKPKIEEVWDDLKISHRLPINWMVSTDQFMDGRDVVDCSNQSYNDADAVIISALLKEQSVLRGLLLEGNHIGDMGAEEIAKSLEKNDSLVDLRLHFNRIGDIGAKGIGQMLAKNNTLTDIRLQNNRISDDGAEHIIEGLASNSTVKYLAMHENNITPHGELTVSQWKKSYRIFAKVYLNKNTGWF